MSEDITSAQMDALQESGGDMTDLRRLAEAGIAGTVGRVTPETWQAILALLDERDRWKKEATVRAGQTALFRRERDAADRRVVALEEGLRDVRRAIESEIHPALPRNEVADARLRSILPVVDRALLAAAPSEWRDNDTWRSHGNRPPGDPAALPAEVGE